MEIVYVFMGRLPSYVVDTVHQARLWSDKKITLICDDVSSSYIDQLRPYNITIVNANEYVDQQFYYVVNTNLQKFLV